VSEPVAVLGGGTGLVPTVPWKFDVAQVMPVVPVAEEKNVAPPEPDLSGELKVSPMATAVPLVLP
jgi:hypothetical protein